MHPYANNQIKTLLINKSLILDGNKTAIGINDHCIELNNNILKDLSCYLSETNSTIKRKSKIIKAENYYLNAKYEGLSLSKRQAEFLFYLLRGHTAKMIGKTLNLSPRTTESYTENLKTKMYCSSKTQLIEKSISLGFLEIVPSGVTNKKISCML